MALNLDKYREIYNKKIAGQKDDKFVNLKDDSETKIRILPPKTDDDLIYFEFATHYIEGQSYTCPNVTFNKPCPLCEFAKKLFATKNEADKQIALDVRAKKRYFLNCIVRGEEDKGVRVWPVGVKLYTKIMEALVNEEIGDVTDLKAGFDMIVRKKKIGGYANYDSSDFARKPSRLSDNVEEIKKWLTERYELNEQTSACLSYDDLKQVMDGNAPDESTPAAVTATPQVATEEVDDIVLDDTDVDTTPAPVAETVAPAPAATPVVPAPEATADAPVDADFDAQLRDLMD